MKPCKNAVRQPLSTEKGKNRSLISKGRGGFPSAAAPSFLSRDRGFSSINLHHKKMRNMRVKESKETGKGKRAHQSCFGSRLAWAPLTFFGLSFGLLAPIWMWGGLESNSKREGKNNYLSSVGSGSDVAATTTSLLLQQLVCFRQPSSFSLISSWRLRFGFLVE